MPSILEHGDVLVSMAPCTCYLEVGVTIRETGMRELVLTFKRRRRANSAVPPNTAMPMSLTSYGTEMQIRKYGGK